MLLFFCILSAFLCTACSLVASPSYFGLIFFALLFSVAHFVGAFAFLQRTLFRAKWLLLLVSIPVFVLTLDNIGRLLYMLGWPSFRILI